MFFAQYQTLSININKKKLRAGEFSAMDKCWVTTAFQIFPRISLTEVQELNLSDDPCNPDVDYNFQACVKENLASQVKKHKI